MDATSQRDQPTRRLRRHARVQRRCACRVGLRSLHSIGRLVCHDFHQWRRGSRFTRDPGGTHRRSSRIVRRIRAAGCGRRKAVRRVVVATRRQHGTAHGLRVSGLWSHVAQAIEGRLHRPRRHRLRAHGTGHRGGLCQRVRPCELCHAGHGRPRTVLCPLDGRRCQLSLAGGDTVWRTARCYVGRGKWGPGRSRLRRSGKQDSAYRARALLNDGSHFRAPCDARV